MVLTNSDEAPCHHHWVIEAANGPMSRGVCRLCQEVREFENSINESRWKVESRANPVVEANNRSK